MDPSFFLTHFHVLPQFAFPPPQAAAKVASPWLGSEAAPQLPLSPQSFMLTQIFQLLLKKREAWLVGGNNWRGGFLQQARLFGFVLDFNSSLAMAM